MNRLVDAPSDDIANVYEEEIGNLTRQKHLLEERTKTRLEPQKPFEDCFKAAMQFFLNPWKLWESDYFAHKRLLLKLTLPEPIIYTREKGFLNPNFALPFKLLGDMNMQNLQMVRTAGLEPARGYPRQILSLLCLPIPPRPQLTCLWPDSTGAD